MRNILFKAKSINNKEWVYGNYITDDKDTWILPIESDTKIQVISNTVCQSLETQDINNIDMFDKDIILVYYKGNLCSIGYIEYTDTEYIYNNLLGSIHDETDTLGMLKTEYGIAVIGNIYDNQDIVNEAKTLKEFYDYHYSSAYICVKCPAQHHCNDKYHCIDRLLSTFKKYEH